MFDAGFPLKRWDIAPSVSPECLGDPPELDSLLVQLLCNRGIRGDREMLDFLSDDGDSTGDPFAMRGMDLAVDRIVHAVARGETIAVYGDFDVDGVTGAVLLSEVLSSLGGRVVPYIPHRIEEGYGLNCGALASLAQQGVSLVVSVDCGVGAVEEVRFAREIGLDVVVVDHHQVPAECTPALAVIDPRSKDCEYPFKELAAVGVAFKLAQALLQKCRLPGDPRIRETEGRLLDLVALGTVADVVPLVGENRKLVRRGLVELNRTRRLGLQALVELAGLRLGAVGAGNIGYIIAPRLNAAGRLSDAVSSYNLLRTNDQGEASQLAGYLDQTNRERQRITDEAVRRAREEILSNGELPRLLMVWGQEYHSGIVGLVAGRLMDEFYRPAVVVELGPEASRGSARSIAELDITEALRQCSDLLVRFGGHARAAGFGIQTENLSLFRSRLQSVVEEQLAGVSLQPRLSVDCVLQSDLISWNTFHLVETMAPFGFGNPAPVFLTRNLWVVESRGVGRDSLHLKLKLADGRRLFNAIAFGLGKHASVFDRKRVDVVYQLESNEWNGNAALQIRVRDLRISDDTP